MSNEDEDWTDDFSDIKEQKCLIHWVRHAESCSNVELDQLDDIDIQKDVQQESQLKQEDLISGLTESFRKGFAIMAENAQDFATQGMVKTYQKTSQPPLSELGMYQASMLGNNIHDDYTAYYCSQSVRTVLTLMLALETKHRYRHPQTDIFVNIVKNITEITNIAGTIGYDEQNAPVEQNNLEMIINYFKNWLNNNYFAYFANLDPKFMSLYGRIIFYIQNSDLKEKQSILNELNKLTSCETNLLNKTFILNNCIGLIDGVVSNDIINELKYYLLKNRFEFIKFNFVNIPKIVQKNNKEDEMESFIFYLLDNHNDGKILCVSHGSLLKSFFNLREKLENTEMLEQNCTPQTIHNVEKIYNQIFTRQYFESHVEILNEIQKCGKICGSPIYTDETKKIEANKLFALISKLASYPNLTTYPINQNEINKKFKINPELFNSTDYFTKYLKYKLKYTKLKKKYF